MKTYTVKIYLNEPDDTIADRLFEAGLDDWLCCHGEYGPYVELEVEATDPAEAATPSVRKLIDLGFQVGKVLAEDDEL